MNCEVQIKSLCVDSRCPQSFTQGTTYSVDKGHSVRAGRLPRILTLLVSTPGRTQGRPESLFYASHTNSFPEPRAPFLFFFFQIRQKHSTKSTHAQLTKESALKLTFSSQSCCPPPRESQHFHRILSIFPRCVSWKPDSIKKQKTKNPKTLQIWSLMNVSQKSSYRSEPDYTKDILWCEQGLVHSSAGRIHQQQKR